MTATNSGSVAAPGFTYANAFLFYGRDESKGPDGETIATGTNSVLMDMNTFTWASEPIAALSCVRFSLAATIPIANNSLASDVFGSISGGGGLADSYYQPVILGRAFGRVDLRAAYGFLAPTGRFHAGASDNVGSGYWTHTLSLGENVYLTEDRATRSLGLPDLRVPHDPGRHGHPSGPDVEPRLLPDAEGRASEGHATSGRIGRLRPVADDRQERARPDARRDGSALPYQRARSGGQRVVARPQGQPSVPSTSMNSRTGRRSRGTPSRFSVPSTFSSGVPRSS